MNSLRNLPSVDQVLSVEGGQTLVVAYGHNQVVNAIRTTLDMARQLHLEKGIDVPDVEGVLRQTSDLLMAWLNPSLVRVINATGVIIHTNLGRAPLSEKALDAVKAVAGGYSTLEYDLESGGRGSRLLHAESIFQQLLGVESALVVNNNASAVLLVLTVLTQGKKVIISRSQLVEIGGGFRIPDVLKHSGTQLVEVGTTNKVHLFDFEDAYSEDTAAVMRAHTSNYAIVGFTSEPDIKEVAASAHRAGLWFFDDLGSGSLLDTKPYGLKHEPMVQESLAAEADLVCFSGDKLLGGPQAGIILGRKELIDQLKSHPLARAIRADKMALAGLSATLEHYLKDEALTEIPKLGDVVESQSMVGGGSLPGETLSTWVWQIDVKHPQQLLGLLREGTLPVIGRVENDRVVFDPRTVLEETDSEFIQQFESAWSIYED